MRKSSRSISLALIGSAFVLGGCQPAVEESEWGDGEVVQAEPTATEQGIVTGNDQYHHNGDHGGRTASRIGGAIIGSQIGRAIGGSTPAPGFGARPGGYGGGSPGSFGGAASGASARGGFGSSAGHSSAS